jgi:hypothetical protein
MGEPIGRTGDGLGKTTGVELPTAGVSMLSGSVVVVVTVVVLTPFCKTVDRSTVFVTGNPERVNVVILLELPAVAVALAVPVAVTGEASGASWAIASSIVTAVALSRATTRNAADLIIVSKS